MNITFVRHGQTDWNLQRKLQGKADIPLNETGILQAKQTAKMLEGKHFDRVYCSPLMRARQTAHFICENRNIPVLYEPRLAERDMGEYEGADWESFDSYAFWDYTADIHYERAENIREFYSRVYSFLDELKGKPGEILIVAHGGVFSPISCYSGHSKEGDNLQDILLKNGEVFQCVI